VTDIAAMAASGKLKITYFGTNWDKGREKLINLLSQYDGVQIYGPRHSWPGVDPRSYGGALPFDGNSVQAKYAENGIGLCLLSDMHLKDDVISNRVFEIASVGAIAICPDMPWLHRYFGDSVYYVDQRLPRNYLVQQILRRREEISADPAAAVEKAHRAREIFDKVFAAEVLLGNAVAYHERRSAKRKTFLEVARTEFCPLISVIIRCGSRPVETIRKAVESISRQTYGRFEIIFVRYKEIDLSAFTDQRMNNIESIRVGDRIGGNRSATLWAGLALVRGQYFSVLDDDDWLFSNHFEMLFQPFDNTPRKQFFAYSGCVAQSQAGGTIEGGGTENRRLTHFGITGGQDFLTLGGAFASNCFVASSDLLNESLLQDPHMSTAEDTYLILSLLALAEARFSFAATSVHERGRPDQSHFANHPSRYEDELTLHLRLHGRHFPKSTFSDTYKIVSEFWARRPDVNGPYSALEGIDRIEHPAGESALSTSTEGLLKRISGGFDVARSNLHEACEVIDSAVGSCTVETPPAPWSYGAELALNIQTSRQGPALIKIRIVVDGGVTGVGLLNRSEKDFLFRVPLNPSKRVQEVEIPVENIHHIGRVVVQTWAAEGKCRARVQSLDVFAEGSAPANHSRKMLRGRNAIIGLPSRALAGVRKAVTAMRAGAPEE
jgi:hypothetical protein